MTAMRRNSSAWGGTGFRRTVCRPFFVLLREKPGRRRWWIRGIHALPGLGSPDADFNVVSRACVEGVSGLHPMQKSRDADVERRLKRGQGKCRRCCIMGRPAPPPQRMGMGGGAGQ